MANLNYGEGEWFCDGLGYDDNIITEIEPPYITKTCDNVTAYKLADRYNFAYKPERYHDFC